MQATDTQDAPISRDGFADLLLAPEETPETANEPQDEELTADDNTADAPETPEDQTEADETSEVETDSPELEADAETDDDDDAPDTADEQPSLYSVKIDGEEREVTLDELKRGYSGQQYIQKGMQEAKAAKAAVEAEQQALAQARQQLDHLMQVAEQDGFRQPTPPDKSLLQTDPIGYMEARTAYEEQVAEYQSNVQAYEQQLQEQQRQQAEQFEAYRNQQREILMQAIPELADTARSKELQLQMRDVAINGYNFSEQELQSVVDARFIQVLHDATKYRQIREQRSKAEKKAQKARPIAKAGAKSTDPRAAKAKAAEDALRKTGSREALQNWLLQG